MKPVLVSEGMSFWSAIGSTIFEVLLSVLIFFVFYYFGFRTLDRIIKVKIKGKMKVRIAQAFAAFAVILCFAMFGATLKSLTGITLML
jgi:hypothetical protein